MPEAARGEWLIETPPLLHLSLDGRGLPTGQSSEQPATRELLGKNTFDDAYDQVSDGAVFAVSGGGRWLEVHFEQGYSAAQIFAPPSEEVVCFEPMNGADRGAQPWRLSTARPGEPAVAQFSVRVA